MKEAKQSTKDKAQKCKKDKLEKAQYFATATAKAASASASATKNNDSDYDKFDKHNFMNAFIKSYDKSKKKSAGKVKRKRSDSDNDSSDSDSNCSNSYKLVALKLKRANIGIPTTEVIGETNVNGNKTPLCILIDTGSSSSIILKKFINNNTLVKNKKTTTEWTTLGGKFYTKNQGTVKFKIPEFFLNKTVEFKVHVDETIVQADASYDMII
jgi:predicted aspartyl protease